MGRSGLAKAGDLKAESWKLDKLTSCGVQLYNTFMKAVTIGDFKQNLPELLKDIAAGEVVLLQKGRSRKNVAVVSAWNPSAMASRKLGLLANRGEPEFMDWEMTEEDLISS
jgi:antitoxin (DNA-binding transcriptional repressor) of toxin-antitoxin stability system